MNNALKLKKAELIGITIEIISSTNQKNIGLKGKIIDETKNMFVIETKKGVKKISKKENTFKVKMFGKIWKIKGESLQKSPEERIKIKR